MIYKKEIGVECYCVDPIKIDANNYDVEITKLEIQYVGTNKFIPKGFKLLTRMEVPYECVYISLESAIKHARDYFNKDAEIEVIDLGNDNWKVRIKK